MPKTDASLIYFFRQGRWVKIGRSAESPLKRVQTLQAGNPNKIKIEALACAQLSEERVIHKHFSAQRGLGEWFAVPPETVKTFLIRSGYEYIWLVGSTLPIPDIKLWCREAIEYTTDRISQG